MYILLHQCLCSSSLQVQCRMNIYDPQSYLVENTYLETHQPDIPHECRLICIASTPTSHLDWTITFC